jgi:hypothetical protein
MLVSTNKCVDTWTLLRADPKTLPLQPGAAGDGIPRNSSCGCKELDRSTTQIEFVEHLAWAIGIELEKEVVRATAVDRVVDSR